MRPTVRRRPPALLLLIAACAHPPDPGRHAHHGHHHRFEDAQRWARVFEDPSRDGWQLPEEVLAALKLNPDSKVADIGSATGYFAVRLSRAVPSGKVYAVDIEPEMQRYLERRAQAEGLKNLVSILGTEDDPRLPEPVDLVLLVDTYHHLGRREGYFSSLRQKLRAGGRLAVIDFKKESPRGPPPEAKLAPEEVVSELSAAGYQLLEEHRFLPDQYFLVFR
ncbi:MAG: methyltransferase domain-containing protein [Myxococcales bacterium]|nr:methyltransferase domain-containing protein [Myxococcales bacterium]